MDGYGSSHLTSTLDGCQLHVPAAVLRRKSCGADWVGGLVGTTADRNTSWRIEIFHHGQESDHDSAMLSAYPSQYTDCAVPDDTQSES